MRLSACAWALALASSYAWTEPVRSSFSLNGAKIGTNTYEEGADGTFKSVSAVNIGGDIHSSLEGRFKDGFLESYVATTEAAARKGTLTFAKGKLAVDNGKTHRELDLKIDAKPLFANFHPQIVARLAREAGAKDAKAVRVFVPESASYVNVDIEKQADKAFDHNGVKEVLSCCTVNLAGLKIELVWDAKGVLVGEHVAVQKFSMTVDGYEKLFVDPLAAFPELSQPTFNAKILSGLKMKTRDGVTLVCDVTLPDKEGKYPVILERTPYGRKAGAVADFWVKRGYAFVNQDVRGREESDGEWDPFRNERKDGADTVNWIAQQPWCDGNVGMIGGSYLGYVQWAAAVEQPKALKCIIPQVSPPDAFNNIPYDQGAFLLFPNLWWANLVKDKATNFAVATVVLPGAKNLTKLPLSVLDKEVLGVAVPFYQKWLERDTESAWQGYDTLKDMGKVTIPSLHISGWWDGDEAGTMLNWQTRRGAGKNDKQWLVYGPWEHGFNLKTKIGDVDYGPSAVIDLDSVYLRFFDTYLKGKDVKWAEQPKVRAFVTGSNEWVTLKDWPDKSVAEEKRLYLFSGQPANGFEGEGELIEKPKPSEPSRYAYNPFDVKLGKDVLEQSPTDGDLTIKDLDARRDFLYYRLPANTKLTAMGPLMLDLYFKTSAKDTDFYAVLVDEDQKGVKRSLCQPGKIRASFMKSFKKREMLEPEKLYHAEIRLLDTAFKMQAGHRLGLMIGSQMFPLWDRNLNTGEPIKSATRGVVALQTIFHDPEHPSALVYWSPKN